MLTTARSDREYPSSRPCSRVVDKYMLAPPIIRRCGFAAYCSNTSTLCSCVRKLTTGSSSLFNPALCSLIHDNETGHGSFAVCWRGIGATTARSGGARAWSGPPVATSPTSGSATSSRVESRNRASVRLSPSRERWGFRWRRGSKILHNSTGKVDPLAADYPPPHTLTRPSGAGLGGGSRGR